MDRRMRFGRDDRKLPSGSASSLHSASGRQATNQEEQTPPARPKAQPRKTSASLAESSRGPRSRATGTEKDPSKSSPPSSSPGLSDSSSEDLSQGEEYVPGERPVRPPIRPKARALKQPPKTNNGYNGKRKASDPSRCLEQKMRSSSGKDTTGIKLPPKRSPPPLFTSITLPAKVSYEERPPAGNKKATSSDDPLLEGIQARMTTTSKEMSFGPGTRVLSSSSIFSADHPTEPDGPSSQSLSCPQSGPSTPTKRPRTGIVLPSKKSTEGEPGDQHSKDGCGGSVKELQESESQWEMLITASQTASKSTPQRRKLRQIKVPTEVRSLKMCPFCDLAMPRRVSFECCEMMQPWLDRYHAGKPIKVTDTAAVCEKHRAESDIIPQGKKQGWPTTLDLNKLEQRLEEGDRDKAFRKEMERLIASPGDSPFMKSALERRTAHAKKMERSPAEILDIQAGYYGESGYELLRKTLTCWFYFQPSDPSLSLHTRSVVEMIRPLTSFEFVGDVMVPELACRLIIDDYGCRKGANKRILTLDEAREIKLESAPYGIAMFPAETAGAGDDLFAKGDLPPNKAPMTQASNSPSAGRRTPSYSQASASTAVALVKSPRRFPGTSGPNSENMKAKARPFLNSPSSSAPTPLVDASSSHSFNSLDPVRPVNPRPVKALSQPAVSERTSVWNESKERQRSRVTPGHSLENDGIEDDDDDDDDDFFDRSRPSISSTLKINSRRQASVTCRAEEDFQERRDGGHVGEQMEEKASTLASIKQHDHHYDDADVLRRASPLLESCSGIQSETLWDNLGGG